MGSRNHSTLFQDVLGTEDLMAFYGTLKDPNCACRVHGLGWDAPRNLRYLACGATPGLGKQLSECEME